MFVAKKVNKRWYHEHRKKNNGNSGESNWSDKSIKSKPPGSVVKQWFDMAQNRSDSSEA